MERLSASKSMKGGPVASEKEREKMQTDKKKLNYIDANQNWLRHRTAMMDNRVEVVSINEYERRRVWRTLLGVRTRR